MIRHLFRSHNGTAAVEAAIFLPLFLALMLGIPDLGSGMFIGMTVNAAAQAGAAYAVINGSGATMTNIRAAMNQAAGDSSFCSTAACSASIGTCADGSPTCVIVTASYPWTPMLPTATYSWAMPTTIAYTTTVRVQ